MKPGTYLDENGEVHEIFFKTPFNHDTDLEAKRTGLECKDPSLAQQQFKEEADINTIVRRFGVTGQLPIVQLPPLLDEFGGDEIFDFQSAMNLLAKAKASFAAMSAEVRDAFQNDPHRFVSQLDAMLTDQDAKRKEHNLTVLRAWGLAVEPGPKADPTTLGDVLAHLKKSGLQGGSPAPVPVPKDPPGS